MLLFGGFALTLSAGASNLDASYRVFNSYPNLAAHPVGRLLRFG